ncbi:hypothetical protein [Nakamurella sp. PAMC28650]|uniref:hypothetical protein n=1 Tax=Nakamurella sp. PAMC28650 TaxID=2762325 RepID=UPI00164DB64B|nr:hypothetical protein [Nakamurella sp. PAMC28650]QNK80423.1 hypothetical protein H7F38_19915 [Nakamurella sp. PAMC28650]
MGNIMTIGGLILRLEQAAKLSERYAHLEADELLLAFINHPGVTAAWNRVPKGFDLMSQQQPASC